MILHPYQTELFDNVRREFRAGRRRVFMSLPCGAGKTAIFSKMAEGARARGRVTMICVPRRELLKQSSKTLRGMGVPHDRIEGKIQASKSFGLHLITKDTLIRRYDKIPTPPDFLILDEAHLYFDQQAEIQKHYPNAKIVGVSASPERLDGRGLSDLYDAHVEGPDIRWLIEHGYLAPMDYYAPPIEGLRSVKRKGHEYDAAELAELLERRRVYGKAIEHYERHAAGKTALVFARSVAAAEDLAGRFRARGWRFESVSAKTPTKERDAIVEGLRSGALHGAVNCEIATYGLDVPRIECLVLLRPTLSRALFTQMIGRGLRTHPGKDRCVILDHVGLLAEHGHPLAAYRWRFEGRDKRRPAPPDPELALHLCPDTFKWCEKSSCVGCLHNTTKRKNRAEHVVDCQLEQVAAPIPLRERPHAEREVYETRLEQAIKATRDALGRGTPADAHGPLEGLLRLAHQIGRNPMWVYHLFSGGNGSVNTDLLREIGRIEGYAPSWVHVQATALGRRLKQKKAATI